MKYKILIENKLQDIRNIVITQNSFISQKRPDDELRQQLERIIRKIEEIEVLLNNEQTTIYY